MFHLLPYSNNKICIWIYRNILHVEPVFPSVTQGCNIFVFGLKQDTVHLLLLQLLDEKNTLIKYYILCCRLYYVFLSVRHSVYLFDCQMVRLSFFCLSLIISPVFEMSRLYNIIFNSNWWKCYPRLCLGLVREKGNTW